MQRLKFRIRFELFAGVQPGFDVAQRIRRFVHHGQSRVVNVEFVFQAGNFRQREEKIGHGAERERVLPYR
jgi:hypothetical protein